MDRRVIIPLTLSLLFLGLLLVIESYIAVEPILPPSLLREKVPILVTLSTYFTAVCNFSIMYFIPMWFQTVSLDSASISGMFTVTPLPCPPLTTPVLVHAGLHLLPHSIGMGLGSFVSGYAIAFSFFPVADSQVLHTAGGFIERVNTRRSTSSLVSFHSAASFPSSSCERIRGSF